MSATNKFTNEDGFTDDDVATRALAKGAGRPLTYDHLVMSAREAYRAGLPMFTVSYGPKGGTGEGPTIDEYLKKAFPSSRVHCDIQPDFKRHLWIEVEFPRN